MTKKVTDIVSYLTPVGLILAFVLGDREHSRFHLNQALVLFLASVLLDVIRRFLGWVPLVGWMARLLIGLIGIALGLFWLIGFISAISGTEKKVPVLGDIQLL